ncbi:MAG: hypothetical protein R3320_09780 [Nitriliruptorales bacterium]|nr:hypothetical protein [Nitriliruptorales bacterium]
MEFWHVALFVNLTIAVGYFAIGGTILRGVFRSGQLRSNPLAVATGLIFVSCAAGHGAHAEHLLLPGIAEEARQVYDWHLTAIDSVTAVVAVRYWMLRGRLPALIRGSQLFEDQAVRRQQALDLQDTVVQRIATAKLALEVGDETRGRAELERALESSRAIIDELLLDETGNASAVPGSLRRGAAATG